MIGALVVLLLGADASVELDAPGCDPALLEAVRSELSAAGFTASGGALVARLSLTPAEGAIDCKVEDRVTHKTVSRALAYDAAAPRAARKLAVQAVELLHASLAEARFSRPAEPVPPAVDRFLEQREPPREPRFHAQATGGALLLTSSLGAQPAAGLQATLRLGPLEAGARATSCLQTWRVTGAAGEADLGLADARLVAQWPVKASLFVLRPELSMGALLAWATGHPNPRGFSGAAGATVAAAPGAALSAELPLNLWLGLTARAGVLVALPAVQVRFAGETVARVGQPAFELSLGLAIR